MSGENIYDIGGQRVNCLSLRPFSSFSALLHSLRKLYFLATWHPGVPGNERHQEKLNVDIADNVTTASGHLGFLFHGFCVHLGLLH